ncbi:MAG: class I SAM-dependent methyltransferase, partial [Terriglobia bacterium]
MPYDDRCRTDSATPSGSARIDFRTKASAEFNMDNRAHWEKIYTEKAADAVSWYCPHLDTSLCLIEELAGSRSDAIIDVGGGQSTLVDDLLSRRYRDVTVLDLSQTAIEATKRRLGEAAGNVRWLVGD